MNEVCVVDGEVPEGWRRCKIGDLCHENRTALQPHFEYARSLPYVGLEHIEAGSGEILLVPDLEGRTLPEVLSTTFHFDARHVLYGKLRPYLNKVATPRFEGRCTTELIPLMPRAGVSRDFLAWLLRRPQTVAAAMRERTGARMPRASMKHVLSLPVLVPISEAEQQRLADEMGERFAYLTQAKRKYEEQIEVLGLYGRRLLSDFATMAAGDHRPVTDLTAERPT